MASHDFANLGRQTSRPSRQSTSSASLAYSSISHVGYILLGLVAGNETGLTGIFYYA